MKAINYYIYYDKNGAFLGALQKIGKPNNTNCKKVTRDEYYRILVANGMLSKVPEVDAGELEEAAETNEAQSTESEVE